MNDFKYKGKSLDDLYLDDLIEHGPCRLLVAFGPGGSPVLLGVESDEENVR